MYRQLIKHKNNKDKIETYITCCSANKKIVYKVLKNNHVSTVRKLHTELELDFGHGLTKQSGCDLYQA